MSVGKYARQRAIDGCPVAFLHRAPLALTSPTPAGLPGSVSRQGKGCRRWVSGVLATNSKARPTLPDHVRCGARSDRAMSLCDCQRAVGRGSDPPWSAPRRGRGEVGRTASTKGIIRKPFGSVKLSLKGIFRWFPKGLGGVAGYGTAPWAAAPGGRGRPRAAEDRRGRRGSEGSVGGRRGRRGRQRAPEGTRSERGAKGRQRGGKGAAGGRRGGRRSEGSEGSEGRQRGRRRSEGAAGGRIRAPGGAIGRCRL
jgi:hypothetical protein